jgi:hypothetical protein
MSRRELLALAAPMFAVGCKPALAKPGTSDRKKGICLTTSNRPPEKGLRLDPSSRWRGRAACHLERALLVALDACTPPTQLPAQPRHFTSRLSFRTQPLPKKVQFPREKAPIAANTYETAPFPKALIRLQTLLPSQRLPQSNPVNP